MLLKIPKARFTHGLFHLVGLKLRKFLDPFWITRLSIEYLITLTSYCSKSILNLQEHSC